MRTTQNRSSHQAIPNAQPTITNGQSDTVNISFSPLFTKPITAETQLTVFGTKAYARNTPRATRRETPFHTQVSGDSAHIRRPNPPQDAGNHPPTTASNLCRRTNHWPLQETIP